MNAAPIDGPPLPSSPVHTLLVVEDEVVTRFMICDALRYHGFRVLEASTVGEALAVLRATPVDLLFVDLHIPGPESGLSVAQAARGLQPSAKIVLTSGRISPGASGGLDDLGPFVPKPYLVSRVIQVIERSLAASDGT